MIITIDGPAGAGKSTVAKRIAVTLGIPHLDSGAYYRMATLLCLRAGTNLDDEDEVLDQVRTGEYTRRDGHAFLNGEDVETEIRGETVTSSVYKIAQNQAVRAFLLAPMRKELVEFGGVVDGRDGATVIAPDADLRVWLTAELQERASRRAAERGELDKLDWHINDLARRDKADEAQMVKHELAVPIDTTGMSLEEVVSAIIQLLD